MRITSIQLNIKDQSKEAALAEALAQVDAAPASDLLLLPEIWTVGFFSFERYQAESEPIDGPVVTAFRQKAIEKRCHLHMGSFVERDGDLFYNTSLLLDPTGEIIAKYQKIHLFGYQSREQQLLTPGKQITTCKTPFGIVGMSTCYDLRFPELYRRMIDQGATMFLVSSAWPLVRLDPWKLFNRVRAVENVSFLVSCNCAGGKGNETYAGHSTIVDPLGTVVAEGSELAGYVTADIDPHQASDVRRTFPALNDRVL